MTLPRSSRLRIVDEELIRDLEVHPDLRESYLFLEAHPDFHGFWRVNSFDRYFHHTLIDEIGACRVVSPASLERFLLAAEEVDYQVAFFDNPDDILVQFAALDAPPEVLIHSDLPGTVNGMLPYQVQGFNFLKDLSGGVVAWSTGTGKTVLACALAAYHAERCNFDLCWFVVKAHNKVNTQRAIQRLVGMDSVVVSGDKKARERTYASLGDVRVPTIIVTNYDKFRVDHAEILPLFEDRDVMCVWDEMPTKLKTRTTQTYKSVCSLLYSTTPPQVKAEKVRPRSLRQFMLSATPIENDPEDFFNCVRLLDPSVYGTVARFRDEYVARYSFFDQNKPQDWHKLDKMGLTAAHIVHQVDKDDPEIAQQFPQVLAEDLIIDWDEQDRKIYDRFTKELVKELDDEINMVSAIGVMQMLCDAPSMVADSAARREASESALEAWMEEGGAIPSVEGSGAALRLVAALEGKLIDARHTKLETLRELLCETHSDEKVVLFSAFNDALLPILEAKLIEWDITYVRYHGNQAERQAAQDAFGNYAGDGTDIRVFLSSDAGSDSINLEAASVVINYDLPWKWSTLIQRVNRIHRVTSKFSVVRFYNLLMANSIEDRKKKIIERKQGYHQGVFNGAISDQAASARMTADDLRYILVG